MDTISRYLIRKARYHIPPREDWNELGCVVTVIGETFLSRCITIAIAHAVITRREKEGDAACAKLSKACTCPSSVALGNYKRDELDTQGFKRADQTRTGLFVITVAGGNGQRCILTVEDEVQPFSIGSLRDCQKELGGKNEITQLVRIGRGDQVWVERWTSSR